MMCEHSNITEAATEGMLADCPGKLICSTKSQLQVDLLGGFT